MKVPNSEQAVQFKENEDRFLRMNKSIERKIASREEEIKKIDESYDKKIEQARENGEVEFMQNLDRNQQRMVGETKNFEDKLQGYNNQLTKIRDTVTKEHESLKGSEQEKLAALKTQMNENLDTQYQSIQMEQDQIQNSTQSAVKEIATKSKTDKMIMENNAQHEINALSIGLNQKAANSELEFRNKLDYDMRTHNAEISRQQDELKKLMSTEISKNKRLSDEQLRVNQSQLDYQNNYQKNLLQQRDQDFKTRYENIVKNHESILKELSTHFEADVKKMVEKTSSDKQKIESRSSDPFYRVEKLNPQLTEDEKTVTVKLPVVEHEKENVHLSAQNRNIKITLSRKYTDDLKGEDGSLNRSTRSELYSKELSSIDLLNPKQITQSYEDGILTFKIKKA